MTPAERPYIPFDRAAGFYEATRHIPPERLSEAVRVIRDDARLRDTHAFLDAGTGTGRFARHFVREGVRVVGVDVSRPMLDQARALCPGLTAVRADLRSLPFPARVFRGALVVHILHLIADWCGVVSEIRRVLVRGGSLYVGMESGKRLRSLAIYNEVAEAHGYQRQPVGAPSLDAILEYLGYTGARVSRVDCGQLCWTARSTVGALIETIYRNPYSHLWHVPPEVHAPIARETERRIRAELGADDAVDEAPAHLILWRARW